MILSEKSATFPDHTLTSGNSGRAVVNVAHLLHFQQSPKKQKSHTTEKEQAIMRRANVR
jgi:hypothetical protein